MKGKAFGLIIVVAISIAVLTGLLGAFGSLSVADVAGTVPFRGAVEISPEGRINAHVLLFWVHNAVHTSYLREVVGTVYDLQAEVWRLEADRQDEKYTGSGLLGYAAGDGVRETEMDVIKVIPESAYEYSNTVFLPTSLCTLQLVYPDPLYYYPSEGLFLCDDLPLSSYSFVTVHYSFDETSLVEAAPGAGGVYLRLPRGLDGRIAELARELTEGLSSPYQKAMVIEAYLEHTYLYDPDYSRAPWGEEPNAWFLFEQKRGVCANFNSAFVLLCRAAGVPARLVSGYKISPSSLPQDVYADQAHVWAEIALEGLGWITMDATGSRSEPDEEPERKTVTSTEVEGLVGAEETLKKGDGFTATGTVIGHFFEAVSRHSDYDPETGITRSYGEIEEVTRPLAGVMVEVYVSQYKLSDQYGQSPGEWDSLSGLPGYHLAGVGTTDSEGVFQVECTIPVEIAAGDYHVLARTVPTEVYLESWSDPEIEVISETGIVITSPRGFKLDEPVDIIGVLREEPGYVESVEGSVGRTERRAAWNPVPDAEVAIYVDDTLVAEVTTDIEGGFRFEWTFTEDRPYQLRAEFGGTEYHLASIALTSVSTARFGRVWLAVLAAFGVACAVLLVYHRRRFAVSRLCLMLLPVLCGVAFAVYGIAVEELQPWAYLAAIPAAVCIVLLLSRIGRALWRRMAVRRITESEIETGTGVEPEPVAEDAVEALAAPVGSQAKQAAEGLMTVDFPQITEPFPDVWGAGEELSVVCSLKNEDHGSVGAGHVEFYLDGSLVGRAEVDEAGSGGLTHTIHSVGEYVVGGRLGDARGERLIRIVDYREEVVRLFNCLLDRLRSLGIGVPSEATPREIQRILLKKQTGVDREHLNRIVRCFEEADYSEHPIERHHYEAMYLSQERLFG